MARDSSVEVWAFAAMYRGLVLSVGWPIGLGLTGEATCWPFDSYATAVYSGVGEPVEPSETRWMCLNIRSDMITGSMDPTEVSWLHFMDSSLGSWEVVE